LKQEDNLNNTYTSCLTYQHNALSLKGQWINAVQKKKIYIYLYSQNKLQSKEYHVKPGQALRVPGG
jgi:hypothetical protein